MSLATYAAALSGLTVVGVVRTYTAPPEQVNHADLPCMYPRLPDTEREAVTLSSTAGLRTLALELVIVVEAIQQGINSVNFATAVGIIDAFEDAIAVEATNNVVDSWATRLEVEVLGDTPYWVIVARVEGSE